VKHFFALFILLFSNWATAETFTTVDAYLEHLTNGQPIVSSSFEFYRSGNVFGAVQWRIPENISDEMSPYLASVFILERLKDNNFKEVIRSIPSGGFSGGNLQVLDGVEIKSDSSFSVNLHNFVPLGVITYRFALIDQSWRFSGRDEHFCFYDKEYVDGCGIEEKRSINFLTGNAIEDKFRSDNLISTKNSKTKFPDFPLNKFKFFDEKYEPL
jgi:hypothetical protein